MTKITEFKDLVAEVIYHAKNRSEGVVSRYPMFGVSLANGNAWVFMNDTKSCFPALLNGEVYDGEPREEANGDAIFFKSYGKITIGISTIIISGNTGNENVIENISKGFARLIKREINDAKCA